MTEYRRLMEDFKRRLIFHYVIACGSFNAAAKVLGVSHQALTATLRRQKHLPPISAGTLTGGGDVTARLDDGVRVQQKDTPCQVDCPSSMLSGASAARLDDTAAEGRTKALRGPVVSAARGA